MRSLGRQRRRRDGISDRDFQRDRRHRPAAVGWVHLPPQHRHSKRAKCSLQSKAKRFVVPVSPTRHPERRCLRVSGTPQVSRAPALRCEGEPEDVAGRMPFEGRSLRAHVTSLSRPYRSAHVAGDGRALAYIGEGSQAPGARDGDAERAIRWPPVTQELVNRAPAMVRSATSTHPERRYCMHQLWTFLVTALWRRPRSDICGGSHRCRGAGVVEQEDRLSSTRPSLATSMPGQPFD